MHNIPEDQLMIILGFSYNIENQQNNMDFLTSLTHLLKITQQLFLFLGIYNNPKKQQPDIIDFLTILTKNQQNAID